MKFRATAVGSDIHVTAYGPFRFPPHGRQGSVFFRFDQNEDLVDTNAGTHDAWAGVMEHARDFAFGVPSDEQATG